MTTKAIFFGDMDPMSNETMGGMKMYFYFTTMVDVILWEGWSADSVPSFIGALAACFAMAIFNQFLYFLVHQRTTKIPIFLQYALKPVAFAMQLGMGYFLMLILMTYNFWLFVSMVVGNTVGYLIFSILIGEVILARNPTHVHHNYKTKHLQYDHTGTVYEEGEQTNFLAQHIKSAPAPKTTRAKDEFFF
jgi:hypothetical protein